MNNFYSLGMDWDFEKDRAISALSTILQDESLQLTVQVDKRGNYFFVKDEENSNTYGQKDVDGYQFDNLEKVMDAFEDFHQSCFFDDLDTRCDHNNIEFGDYDAAVGYLLTPKEFRQILRSVTPRSDTPTGWPYPTGITAEINQMKLVNFAEKLLCKEILSTMSAYVLVENTLIDVVWLSKYGVGDGIEAMKHNPSWNFTNWWHSVMTSKLANELFTRYESYAQLLKTLQTSVTEDFDDFNDFNEMGSDFYLNKAALCFMGLNRLIYEPNREYAFQAALKEPLTQADKEEMYGQFIDLFEDFLEERNVCFGDPKEKDTSEKDAVITGDDYDELKQNIESLLVNWNLI